LLLRTQLDVSSDTFTANQEHHEAAWRAVADVIRAHKAGGSPKAAARHKERGKLLVRERVAQLLDPGTPFLELSVLAGHGLYREFAERDSDALLTERGPCASGGVVTGIGIVAGQPVAVMANDPTVKGGSYFPITLKKHLRLQAIAANFRLPCVYLVDSGGAFLPMQEEVFPDREHFGRIFYNMAQLSAAGLPQLSVVLGRSTAGGAYVPAMSDEVVMVRGASAIYLGGPPLVEAATGERVSDEELGGADVHCRISGVADRMEKDEASALAAMREIVATLPRPHAATPPHPPQEPLRSADELTGVVPANPSQPYDPREILVRVIDAGDFVEFKPHYGVTLVCGFARIMGFPVAILANYGPLDAAAALKASHFVQMADQRRIPLLFLQNIPGFFVGKEHERAGIARDGAKMVRSVANASVPKLTLVVGGSHGAGNYSMCGRAYDPHLLFAWPSAKVSVMSGEAAASVLTTIKTAQYDARNPSVDQAQLASLRQKTLADYAQKSEVKYGSARLWDDGVIAPRDTRNVLGLALSALASGLPTQPTTAWGVYRM